MKRCARVLIFAVAKYLRSATASASLGILPLTHQQIENWLAELTPNNVQSILSGSDYNKYCLLTCFHSMMVRPNFAYAAIISQ